MKNLICALSFLLLTALPIACDLGGDRVTEPARLLGGNAGPEQERQIALAFATQFVETLDRGERVAPMLAAFLREDVTDDALEAAFNGFRSWTGPFDKRNAFAYGFSETVPDLPAGQYFTVLYRSHFERGHVEEKVIVSVDEKGASVAGYSQSKRVLYSDAAGPPLPTEPMPPQGTMTR